MIIYAPMKAHPITQSRRPEAMYQIAAMISVKRTTLSSTFTFKRIPPVVSGFPLS